MSFKLKYANDRGSINLKLDQKLEPEELKIIWEFVSSLLIKENDSKLPSVYYSEEENSNQDEIIQSLASSDKNGSRRLGEKPSNTFHMGKYVEPDNGFSLKMLHFPIDYMKATKIVRECTNCTLPIKSCADIVAGNCLSPIFSKEVTELIMNGFKNNNVYAKAVPTTKAGATKSLQQETYYGQP